MTSVYYHEPFFRTDYNRLFEDATGSRPGRQLTNSSRERDIGRHAAPFSGSKVFQPRVDVHESPENNIVTATIELPGIKKEDVHIDVQNGNRLVISGETIHSRELNEDGYIHRERRTGKFLRSLPLPGGSKPTDVKAVMENGVLVISFPKTSPEQAPQRITIQ